MLYFKHKQNKNKIVKFHNNKDKNDDNQIVNYKILKIIILLINIYEKMIN